MDTINNDENIKKAIVKYVSGIGLSVQKASDVDVATDFINEMLGLGKHVSLHIIPEMIGIEETKKILHKMINEYLSGLTEIYTIAGLVFIIPVHAIVIILEFSILPQDTITAGSGYKKVPGFHITFDINSLLFLFFHV